MEDKKTLLCNATVFCKESILYDTFDKSVEEIFPDNIPYLILDNAIYSSEKLRKFIDDMKCAAIKACPDEYEITVLNFYIVNPASECYNYLYSKGDPNANISLYLIPLQELSNSIGGEFIDA